MGFRARFDRNYPPWEASMCVVKKGDVERHGFLDSKQELSDLFTGDSDNFHVVSRFSLRAVRALLRLRSVWGRPGRGPEHGL